MAGLFFSNDELNMPGDSRPYPDELYIFGAGSMGRELLGRLGQSGHSVRAFLDNNPRFWKEKVAGLPVLNPEAMRDNLRATVILASLAAEAMRAHCRQIGLDDVVSMAEAVRRFKLVHAFGQIETEGAAALDIEGYEMFALAGTTTIIRRQRPLLAISSYHQLEHFWQIPLWIRKFDPGYRLRLLHHGNSYAESVCYGIPG